MKIKRNVKRLENMNIIVRALFSTDEDNPNGRLSQVAAILFILYIQNICEIEYKLTDK